MKKTLLILSFATGLLMFACGSDRTHNSNSDTMMNGNPTMDTATMSIDSGPIGVDTTMVGPGQTGPESTPIHQ